MKKIISVAAIIALLSGCDSSKSFGEAAKMLSENCAKPMSGSVEDTPFGRNVKFECPEMKGTLK